MNNSTKRILEVIEKLDLSPTMHQDATTKYQNICTYLNSKGIEAEFYPQGSFSFGTVIRPFSQEEDLFYDLDVVCQVHGNKSEVTPLQIKQSVGNALKDSETYKNRLHKEDQTCWTLEYAGVDNFDLKLDIVPSVQQDEQEIYRLRLSDLDPSLANTAISITKKQRSDHYDWVSSNPKGLTEWFNRINRPFYNSEVNLQKEMFFKSDANTFASIEDVPDYVVKSNLQRSIQFLKRHRDIYFYRIGEVSNKPSSIVITVLMGLYAENANPAIELLDLLSGFIGAELKQKRMASYNPILENPSQPEDNLLESWSSEMINKFFSWLESLQRELQEIQKDGIEAIKSVDLILYTENLSLSKQYEAPDAKNITIQTRPWRE